MRSGVSVSSRGRPLLWHSCRPRHRARSPATPAPGLVEPDEAMALTGPTLALSLERAAYSGPSQASSRRRYLHDPRVALGDPKPAAFLVDARRGMRPHPGHRQRDPRRRCFARRLRRRGYRQRERHEGRVARKRLRRRPAICRDRNPGCQRRWRWRVLSGSALLQRPAAPGVQRQRSMADGRAGLLGRRAGMHRRSVCGLHARHPAVFRQWRRGLHLE